MSDHPLLEVLADQVRHSSSGVVVLTGAGISLASGVPTFRGKGGLWDRYDPYEYATIAALRDHPEKVWRFLRELDDTLLRAEPNVAHTAIATLEDAGLVHFVITQNVDGLHQAAGSKRVIELHGSHSTITCLDGRHTFRREDLQDVASDPVPRCPTCGSILKPDVVFFGEQLPFHAYRRAEHAVRSGDLLIVIGTSLEVEPAASLPDLARHAGTSIWEINPKPELAADGTIALTAEQALPTLVQLVKPRSTWRTILDHARGRRS